MTRILTGLAGSALVAALLLISCRPADDGGGNHHPVIVSAPVTAAVADLPYSYQVEAKDPDGGWGMRFSLTVAPAGMTVEAGTGRISWTPNSHQVGNHRVTVRASDGKAGAEQSFAVRVIPDDNGVPFMRAFNLVAWGSDPYLQPQTEQSLRQLSADGVEYVFILVTWYGNSVDSPSVSAHPVFTATDAGVVHAIQYAHSLGLKVGLKPHVDLLDGNWRGDISFSDDADWQAWFDSYNDYLGHYLDLAEANGVEAFIVGTELKGTEGREAQWRDTIASARTKFSGLLTYGANHDSFFAINWWDAVDLIGISAYFGLTGDPDPTLEEIKAAWATNKNIIRIVAAIYQRDVMFTEIGYQSRDGANMVPYQDRSGWAAVDLQEQADCYRAALEVFYNEPWFKGMSWWAWSWDPTTIYNEWDVAGKPAESVIRAWYAGRD